MRSCRRSNHGLFVGRPRPTTHSRTASSGQPEVHTSTYLRKLQCGVELVPRPARIAFLLLDHAPAAPVTPPRAAVSGCVARSVVDVRGTTQVARAPRRPEDEVGEEGDQPDDDHDPADGVDVDRSRIRRMHGEREDEAHDGDDQSDHETHSRLVPGPPKSNPLKSGSGSGSGLASRVEEASSRRPRPKSERSHRSTRLASQKDGTAARAVYVAASSTSASG